MNLRNATAAAGTGLAILFSLACGGSDIDTAIFMADREEGGTTTCPADASTAESFEDGQRAVLLALHSDDAYAGSDVEDRLPVAGTVQGGLHNNGDCWFGGGFVGDDETDFYFYKGAFRAE